MKKSQKKAIQRIKANIEDYLEVNISEQYETLLEIQKIVKDIKPNIIDEANSILTEIDIQSKSLRNILLDQIDSFTSTSKPSLVKDNIINDLEEYKLTQILLLENMAEMLNQFAPDVLELVIDDFMDINANIEELSGITMDQADVLGEIAK